MLTTVWTAIGNCEPASLWSSNGSVMSMEVVGADHVFRYQEPRIGMRQEGVVPGTVRFKGTRSGNTYAGTAFVFSRRCGAHPFRVTGTISPDEREIEMYGSAPGGFDTACRPVAYRRDGVHFSFLRLVDPPPQPSSAAELTESQGEAARADEARAAQEREELRLRDLQEQENQARIALEQRERAERDRREREQEEARLAEMRDLANQREACRKYVIAACDAALKSPRILEQDAADLQDWRGVAEKFAADRDKCRAGSVAACNQALASPAAGAEQRHLLNEWRSAAAPFNRAIALLSSYAGMAAATIVNTVGAVRNLPTIVAGVAAIVTLALALAGMALRLQYAAGGTHPPTPSASGTAKSTASKVGRIRLLSGRLGRWLAVALRRTPAAGDASEALRLAHAHIEEVREAATPAREEHEARKHHLSLLARASKQLDIARKRDPDAVLEGKDESGLNYRFTIDELKAEAFLLEGITQHEHDRKRAIRALRKATALNADNAYAFYVLGVMYATSLHRTEAMAALGRAVALKPQNTTYRQELDRAQNLPAAESAGIFNSHRILEVRNVARSLRRAHFSLHRGALRLLELPRLH